MTKKLLGALAVVAVGLVAWAGARAVMAERCHQAALELCEGPAVVETGGMSCSVRCPGADARLP